MRRFRIKLWTKDETIISKICCRFNLDYHPTLNSLMDVEISDEDVDLFKETARRGFFSICQESGS